MRFEWDENKRRLNLAKHEFDFAEVEDVFDSETITILDYRFDYGEIRYVTFGILNGEIVAITHTETDNVVRVISFRKAAKNEEEYYFREIRN